jgi:predicted amidohydrolase
MSEERHVFLLVDRVDGRPAQEPVHAADLGDGAFRLLYSPGFLRGLAARDEFRVLDEDGAFEVTRRAGNLAAEPEESTMDETTVRVGMAQILVEAARPDANLGRAEAMIGRAAARGCAAVVLPECLDLGWTDPSARDLAQPVPGATSARLAGAAVAHSVYVVAGLTERAGDRLYNAAVLIGPDGRILLKHRKINELDIAHDVYAIGDSLGVAHTPLGTIAINVCADNFPDTLVFAHAQARMGAQMLLSPAAWAVDADHSDETDRYGSLWETGYTSVARLFGMAVVGVSNVGAITSGPWAGRKCIGCSLAVAPGGQILARGPYGDAAEALVVVEVPVAPPGARGTAISERLRAAGYDPARILDR